MTFYFHFFLSGYKNTFHSLLNLALSLISINVFFSPSNYALFSSQKNRWTRRSNSQHRKIMATFNFFCSFLLMECETSYSLKFRYDQRVNFIHHRLSIRSESSLFSWPMPNAMQSNYSRTYFKIRYFFPPPPLPSSHFCIGSLAPRMQCICTFVVHFALLLFYAFYDVSLSHHRPPPTPLLFYCEHSAVQSRRRFLLSPLDYYFSFQPTMKVHTHNTKDYKAKKKGKSEVGGEKIGDD